MPKTCGQCAHAEAAGETVVWCYGAPPAVMSAKPAENGGTEVQIQRPLIPNTSRACAVFKQKRNAWVEATRKNRALIEDAVAKQKARGRK